MSADSPDPLAGFDATIHAPNRLRVCALLDTAGEAEFARVQRHLGVSASVLSKHVTVLMDAGYVAQRKATRDTRQRVWLHLTPEGRTAYHRHLAALHAIVGPSKAEAAPPSARPPGQSTGP